MTNGTSSCSRMRPIASSDEDDATAPPSGSTTRLTSTGVMNTPSSVEAEALQMAAGMFPRAIAVKAIADCTVAGSTHRNSTPVYSCGVTSGPSTGRSASPSTGNRMKVQANTSRCSRQCVMPARIASRDSLAPCRKNSSPIATVVRPSKKCATRPLAGSRLARVTTATSVSVKLSGRKRERAMACIGPSGHSKEKWIYRMDI
ncbi:hypothetical protein D9M72_277160 [compost metagenome]